MTNSSLDNLSDTCVDRSRSKCSWLVILDFKISPGNRGNEWALDGWHLNNTPHH